VRDFVADDRGEPSFRFGDRKDAGVDDDFSTGQTKGIYLVAVDDADLPIEGGSGAAGLRGDAGRDAADGLGGWAAFDNIGTGEHFLECLETERFLLIGGHGNSLHPAGFRVREAIRAHELEKNHDTSDDEWHQF
jgi:hypothetical protein